MVKTVIYCLRHFTIRPHHYFRSFLNLQEKIQTWEMTYNPKKKQNVKQSKKYTQ